MSYKRMILFAAVLTAMIASPAHAIQLDFYQVDWMGDTSEGMPPYVSQNSDWGRVEITLTSADHGWFSPMTLADGTAGWGGFITVVTDSSGSPDWNIKNLPIFYENPSELDGRLPQGVLFDLGVTPGTPGVPGVDVTVLNYDCMINPTPMPTSNPPSQPLTSAGVNPFEILAAGDKIYMFGNINESGGMSSPQAAMNFPGAESGEVIAERAKISIPEKSVASVDEDKNGCAPGSVARSIKYMSDSHANVNVPDGAQTVYGELRTAMNTDAAGTATADILSGKNTYVNNHGLPIVSTQTQSFEKAIETLKNGGDVEVGMSWGTGKGAHRAFVSEIQRLEDADGNTTGYVVKTVDDSKQGDDASNNATHTAKFDAAGNLVQYDGKVPGGVGAGLINFQTENVYASTVVLEFPFGGSVTYPAPPGGYIPTPFGSIPVGVPGSATSLGGVRIRFEGANAEGGAILAYSELVANPQALPEMGQTLDINLDVDLVLEDPAAPTMVSVGLQLEHLRPDGSLGELLPVLSEGTEVFLENIIVGSSFFDITYEINTGEESFEDGDGYQVFRLHGEVPEELLESVWILGVEEVAPSPGPDFPAESFFDVYFELNIDPGAYGFLTEPGLDTLFNMELTAVATPDLMPGMPGDANNDGIVNEGDAAILAENWLRSEDAAGRPLTWADGDFNGDGCVNEVDVTMMATNWMRSMMLPPGDSVPEPGAVILMLIGCLCLLVQWRPCGSKVLPTATV